MKQLEGRMAEVAQLSKEYAALLAEKKARYEEYKAVRKEMIDYQTAKNNVDRILGLTPPKQEKFIGTLRIWIINNTTGICRVFH